LGGRAVDGGAGAAGLVAVVSTGGDTTGGLAVSGTGAAGVSLAVSVVRVLVGPSTTTDRPPPAPAMVKVTKSTPTTAHTAPAGSGRDRQKVSLPSRRARWPPTKCPPPPAPGRFLAFRFPHLIDDGLSSPGFTKPDRT